MTPISRRSLLRSTVAAPLAAIVAGKAVASPSIASSPGYGITCDLKPFDDAIAAIPQRARLAKTTRLSRFKPGEEITSARMNEMIDAIRALQEGRR